MIIPIFFPSYRVKIELLQWSGVNANWQLQLLASFWSVPVNYEPSSVNGSNKPAVSPEHVDEQQSAGSTYSKTL